jgi:hypothetical protein
MQIIFIPLLAISFFIITFHERNEDLPANLEKRSKYISEKETTLSRHPELHGFPMSSQIWIDKELTSLEEHNIHSSRLGYSIRSKHPEVQEKVRGVFAHSTIRIMPPGRGIPLKTNPQGDQHSKEQISRILKRINSVYQSLNYPVIYPDDIEAWWEITDWKEKEGLAYDRYRISSLILKNGYTLFIFDRRPVLSAQEVRYL